MFSRKSRGNIYDKPHSTDCDLRKKCKNMNQYLLKSSFSIIMRVMVRGGKGNFVKRPQVQGVLKDGCFSLWG